MAAGILTLACLVLGAGPIPGDVVPINQKNFQIPIKIDPVRRGEIKELKLFASSDQGRTWQHVATAAPDQDAFTFYAQSDGVFWFNVAVIDTRGNSEPKDVFKATPGQKVMIDTLKPAVRLTTTERQGDEVTVGWEIQEDHPDLTTLKLEYKASDAPAYAWTTAALSPSLAGHTRFKVNGPSALVVRMQMMDQAGNVGMAEAAVKGQPGPVTPVAAEVPAPNSPSGAAPPPVPAPAAPVLPQLGSDVRSTPRPGVSDPLPGNAMAHTTQSSGSWQGSGGIQPASMSRPEPRTWSSNDRLMARSTDAGSPVPSATVSPRGKMPDVQITNSPRINLEYDVSKVGPSGIGSVKLYVTQDDGKTWTYLADDPDLKSPISVDLPGEGVYGLWLVVTSGAGRGARREPQPGDLPQMRIEVDTTPPDYEFYAPEATPGQRNTLLLTWKAQDRNLAANPITLQWAAKPNDPWQDIAINLPNSGRHTWTLPQGIPMEVYLRILVRDTAGNVSIGESPKPVLVDLSEPEGVLKSLIKNEAPMPMPRQ